MELQTFIAEVEALFLQTLTPSMGTPELTVHCETEAIVEWDRFRVEQVIFNLLTNAARYGAGRPIELSVTVSEAVVIRVKDSGIGIAPANLERIFKRFERAVGADQPTGLGLGLYICEQIVRLHGGAITVSSELDRGSVFEVRLPFIV